MILETREFIHRILNRKSYIIIAKHLNHAEAQSLECKLNKQRFTVLTEDVEVKEV